MTDSSSRACTGRPNLIERHPRSSDVPGARGVANQAIVWLDRFMVNAEHEALRETVRTLLDRTADSALVRTADGYSEPLWRALADQVGVAGLTVPERYDGAGATLLEAHIVLEETGRTLAPVPVLGSLLAAQALIRCDNEEARARLLPEIAAGRVATLGWQDDGYVLDGDIAEITLIVSGDNLYEIVPTHRERKPTMDF